MANVLHHFPRATTTRADRINIIHCAARSCKVLCEINTERTDKVKSILKEFANDNLHPGTRDFVHNSEFGRAAKRLSDTETALLASLCEPEKKLLNDFTKAQEEVYHLSYMDKFIYGYRLGVLMTMEVFQTSDDIVTGGEGE